MASQVDPHQCTPPLVLFLCRSNTHSSIMAEAILEHHARERVRAASAGDIAAGQINPYALECLRAHGIATTGLRSKPWGEFFGLHKPTVRFVIALCEVDAIKVNWGSGGQRVVRARWEMPDPAAVVGSAFERRLAFDETFGILDARIKRFLSVPLDALTDSELSKELATIGENP